jgi:hypothetical protein
LGTSEGSFAWTNGDPILIANWNAGEPDDFGGAEDATEMTNTGKWNDNAAGPSLGQGSRQQGSLREYKLQLSLAQVSQTNTLKITSYKSATEIANLAAADALIGGAGQTRATTSYYSMANMADSGGVGDFGNDNGVVGILNEDDFAVQGTGYLRIEPGQDGNFVFRLNADDGQRLRIDLTGDGDFNDVGELVVNDDVLSGPPTVSKAIATKRRITRPGEREVGRGEEIRKTGLLTSG